MIADENTSVLVQGITGREGSFHTRLMKEYGTKILAGVTPGKGGASVEGIPVYNTVREALSDHPGIKFSVVFVPTTHCFNAVLEAIEAEIPWIVVVTEGIPVKDTLWLVNYAQYKGCRIIGPNGPGLIVPGRSKIGIMPDTAFSQGKVGLISRSGTLTYEVGNALKVKGLGVSTAVGVGGDAVVGTTMLDVAKMLEADATTEVIVVLGEIGGDMEEEFASAISSGTITKPTVAFIAGVTAPPGKRMGHAGAILSEGRGSASDKLTRLKAAGAHVVDTPWKIPDIVKKYYKMKR